MSKTLGEIITAVRDGEKPDYDDLRFAICCLDIMGTFDRRALDSLAEAEREGKKPFMTRSAVWQQQERFERMKRQLAKTPLEILGDTYHPDNPEVQERRQQAVALVNAAVEGKLKRGDQ